MKLAGVLATALLLAAPVAAAAPGHGGVARVGVGVVASGGAGVAPGPGRVGDFHRPGPGRGSRDRFLVWGWPYWGWSDCGLYGDNCDWDGPGEPGPPADGFADASMTDPPCGAWVSRAGGYAWAPDACRGAQPAAADPPPHPALAANECSDWVWRASLHHSVCRRPSRLTG